MLEDWSVPLNKNNDFQIKKKDFNGIYAYSYTYHILSDGLLLFTSVTCLIYVWKIWNFFCDVNISFNHLESLHKKKNNR